MYYSGEWLPICDQDIDDNISNLICRDLGFDVNIKINILILILNIYIIRELKKTGHFLKIAMIQLT